MKRQHDIDPCTYLMGFVLGTILAVGRLLRIVTVRGLENFPHGEQRIVAVGNHPYKGEQFLLIALFFPGFLLNPRYGPYTMADMRNYFDKFPWRLCRSRLISVDRTGKLTGATSLEVALDVLRNDGNIIIFPSGTRDAKVPPEKLLRSPKNGKPMGPPLKKGFVRLVTEVPDTKLVPVWFERNHWYDIRLVVGASRTFDAETPAKAVLDWTAKTLLELADQAL